MGYLLVSEHKGAVHLGQTGVNAELDKLHQVIPRSVLPVEHAVMDEAGNTVVVDTGEIV